MRRQIEDGRQIYVVYPLISESETLDYKDLEDGKWVKIEAWGDDAEARDKISLAIERAKKEKKKK